MLGISGNHNPESTFTIAGDKLIERLTYIKRTAGDEDQDHINADEAILIFLEEIGLQKAVKIFDSIDKWYT